MKNCAIASKDLSQTRISWISAPCYADFSWQDF